jgi:hypothetical protein
MFTGLYIFIAIMVIFVISAITYTIWSNRKDAKRMNTMK